ncbi:carbohydrate binding family 9 domain-containing protein [Aliifodinibius halophilus]|uniref:Carbohydrate binding family 9 domain-containing protein n=2 Tax=Fodinibius halophilus TaxID=1736908 RepID=A0A6M1SXL7_9BACT|nr:carbohydrate binding family 9 domain-containing protein [Fodinibius halophilus]
MFVITNLAWGQETTEESRNTETTNPSSLSLGALKISPQNEITLDGKLDENIWKNARIATDFTQRIPNDGAPASEKTEVQVVYSNDALYVGIRAFDSAMDSVAATLFRKDGAAYSDWVYVSIDSYSDNRTSFNFAVNPRGVQKDILIFNDSNEDKRWDAVWETKTTILENSWVAELRIPLSQLRFDTDKTEQSWGINFQRRLARKEEISFWSPTPQDASGLVSLYGELTGIKELPKINRLEITPYASSDLTKAPGDDKNPYYNANDWNGSIGADIKYSLTPDLTLTGTINPDFGQVEADPAVINLSAFETFFPEQRPFFLEGTDIFEFGRTKTHNTFGNPLVFYSRRIGRRPQGNASNSGIDPQYTDVPSQTTIASAAKLSGKTDNGFSLGILNAFTLREKAQFQTTTNTDGSVSVEPPTNYFVGRVKQDFDGGQTTVGAYGSAVNRSIRADYLSQSLHNSAYIAGLDFEHSWKDREWILSGTLSGISVNGSKEAIAATQRSSARYYNRVDADYLSVDPNKTNLSGYAGELSIGKFGGDHWRGSLTYSTVSPGYEVNDIGFENRADYHALSYFLSYQESSPELFRFYKLWAFAGHGWNYGGDLINNYYRTGAFFQLKNLWSFNYNAGFNGKSYLDRLSRGGPVAERAKDWNFNININSDQTRKVSFNIGTSHRSDVSGEFDHSYWTGLEIRPATFIQLSISPQFSIEKDTDQYVTSSEDPSAQNTYGNRYVFADIDKSTLSTSIRLDWTFTPSISLQTYVRPFITSGNFYNYKEFTAPYDYKFAVYGEDRGVIQKNNDVYTVDPDGAGTAPSFTFEEQDFNFKSIQTNAVFRWEYQPGSIFYLVWQQDQSHKSVHNDFRLGRDIKRLFDTKPTTVFLLKFSYWFGS